MSDRVQALRNGIDERMQTAREEGLQSQVWKRQADVDEFVRFLASQELGWAEKSHRIANFPFSTNEAIYLLKGVRAGLDMPLMTFEYQTLTAMINMIDEGAVKFVPLEIK